jgi:hypothetical protein
MARPFFLEEKMDIMGVVPALLSYLCGVGTKLKGGGMDYQVGTDQFHEICHDIWVYYGIFYHIIGSHIVYIYMHISFSIGSDPKKWKKDQFH